MTKDTGSSRSGVVELALAKTGKGISALRESISGAFMGKEEIIDLALAALLGKGHLLLEDVPGVGKTTLAKALARALECSFNRIQFTSDMLPSDIIGTMIFDQQQRSFQFERGPIFSQIILADELNRASPRTQSALLEAMNEEQVTVDTETMPLAQPFFVLATQNPLELHGTYPLPESQLDRFMMCLSLGYPEEEKEKAILSMGGWDREVEPVMTAQEVLAAQEATLSIKVHDKLLDYAYRIIKKTRGSSRFLLGASPRAGIHLLRAARALAVVKGRDYLLPDDIKAVTVPVLAHRLMVQNVTSLGEGKEASELILADLLEAIPAP